MTRLIRFLTLPLMLAAVAAPASAQTTTPTPVIVTQGEATLKRPADQAWLSIAVEARDVKADEARRKGAEGMTAAQAALRGVGLPADAIRTTRYSLSPDMEYVNGRGTMKGYIVRNQIEVRLDNIDRVSDVIDAVNATRNAALTIAGPRFALKDQQAAENDALKLAVTAALARAQAIATGAKKTLGNIVRIEEPGARTITQAEFGRSSGMAMQAASIDTPITAGDIEVRVQITLTVELR